MMQAAGLPAVPWQLRATPSYLATSLNSRFCLLRCSKQERCGSRELQTDGPGFGFGCSGCTSVQEHSYNTRGAAQPALQSIRNRIRQMRQRTPHANRCTTLCLAIHSGQRQHLGAIWRDEDCVLELCRQAAIIRDHLRHDMPHLMFARTSNSRCTSNALTCRVQHEHACSTTSSSCSPSTCLARCGGVASRCRGWARW